MIAQGQLVGAQLENKGATDTYSVRATGSIYFDKELDALVVFDNDNKGKIIGTGPIMGTAADKTRGIAHFDETELQVVIDAVPAGTTINFLAGSFAITSTYNAIPAGAVGTVEITADNAGAEGNKITITGDGSQNVSGLIAFWNGTNPTNTATVVQGGTEVPDNGEVITLSATYTVNKKIKFEGQGADSVIDGNINFQAGADFSSSKNVKFNGNVDIDSGAESIVLTDSFASVETVLTDNNSSRANLYILLKV